MTLRFGLLGPLDVRAEADATAVTVSAGMQRAVLAALLLRPNQAVSVDSLIEILWNGRSPATARPAVLNYVARLRRVLGAEIGARIRTSAAGYTLRIEHDGELDRLEAEALERRAEACARAGDWAQVSVLARCALDLWRGEPLEDVAAPVLCDEHLPNLTALRARLEELDVDASLLRGEHERAIASLNGMIRVSPLREHLYERLMIALGCVGRRSDALEAYRSIRSLLREELGVDPGARLYSLHQLILDGADAPALLSGLSERATASAATISAGTVAPRAAGKAPAAAGSDALPDAAVPRQLPAAVRGFSGRGEQLAALDAAAERAGVAGHGASIVVVTGAAGIGKTSLAVHWGHRAAAAGRFPGGQLYVNLRGFDPTEQPIEPSHVLRGFLTALGVAPSRIPPSAEAQASLYRSLIAHRKALVILDNARDAEQVRPLLPGDAECMAVVTSRLDLAGLVAIEGALPLHLGLPTAEEARDLLAARLGADLIAAESEAAERIIDLCGLLPLALSVVAARIAVGRGRSLGAVARSLNGARDRLDVLTVGDTSTDVRAVFSWSYRLLDTAQARLFRILGLHPGPDFTAATFAGMLDADFGRTEALLDELTSLHLLARTAADRYAMHDLLRDFAAESARKIDGEQHTANFRLAILDHYLHTAYAAERLLQPARPPVELEAAAREAEPLRFTDATEAMAWYEAECEVLLAATAQAAATGLDRYVWQLPWAMTTYLDRSGRWHDLADVLDASVRALRRLGDGAGEIQACVNHGQVLKRLEIFDQAAAAFEEALRLSQAMGDLTGQARAYLNRARLLEARGRHQEGLDESLRAAEIYQALGEPVGVAFALNTVASNATALGRNQDAIGHCETALAQIDGAGARVLEGDLWDTLGTACRGVGDSQRALSCFLRAKEIFADLGERFWLARTIMRIGDVHLDSGDTDGAREHWSESLEMLTALEHPSAADVCDRLSSL